MRHVISAGKLRELLDQLGVAQGTRLVGPAQVKPGLVTYQRLESAAAILLEGFVRPANSIKEFFFPRCETLYEYRFEGKRIELSPPAPPAEQIIVGARPCDAAAMAILEGVFDWGSRDAFFFARRQRTTVVTLACRTHDAACYCTTVGCGPRDERGSDAMLFELGDGTYEVSCLTEKGTQLFSAQTQPTDRPRPAAADPGPEPIVDLDVVGRFLAARYDDPLWQAATQSCLGCGACAYTCPTCHCFDIHDEGNARGGRRVRTWDACQFALFTAHASGHNPRSVQSQRQRQRIYHKFQTYPERFGEILCTGCGNCTRNCPVGLGVRPVLERLAAEEKSR